MIAKERINLGSDTEHRQKAIEVHQALRALYSPESAYELEEKGVSRCQNSITSVFGLPRNAKVSGHRISRPCPRLVDVSIAWRLIRSAIGSESALFSPRKAKLHCIARVNVSAVNLARRQAGAIVHIAESFSTTG